MKKKAQVVDWVDRLGGLLFAILVPLYYILQVKSEMKTPGVVYCMNDVYCCIQDNGVFAVFPFAELILLNKLKYEFRAGVLLRTGSMKKMWLRLCKKTAGLAAVITVYVFVVSTVIGSTFCTFSCNWEQRNSNAYYVLRRSVDIEIPVIIIMFLFLLAMFAMLFAAGLLIVYTWWFLGQPILGYMAVMVLMIVELKTFDVNVFFLKICMNWARFYYQGINWFQEVVFPLLVMAGLFGAGFFIFRRKDMLKKEGDGN